MNKPAAVSFKEALRFWLKLGFISFSQKRNASLKETAAGLFIFSQTMPHCEPLRAPV